MPKGSKLRELWADPEWREGRIKALRENRAWIEKRAANLSKGTLSRAIKARKHKARAKNYDLERQNALLLFELDQTNRAHDKLLERLQQIYIAHDLDKTHDKLEEGKLAGRSLPIACNVTPEEYELIRAARVALGMTKGVFLRESAVFYAMWALDQHNRKKLSGEDLREEIGLRANIDEDVSVWSAMKMAAE